MNQGQKNIIQFSSQMIDESDSIKFFDEFIKNTRETIKKIDEDGDIIDILYDKKYLQNLYYLWLKAETKRIFLRHAQGLGNKTIVKFKTRTTLAKQFIEEVKEKAFINDIDIDIETTGFFNKTVYITLKNNK